MNEIHVRGCGAVSPAGWGMDPLRESIARNQPIPPGTIERPGWPKPLAVLQVPAPPARPAFFTHARLRRTSPITQYAVAAALEALGDDAKLVTAGSLRLGLVFCAMSGCVNYSRRFYDEALRDPATASPLVFPETVFNAPASHLAALLGSTAINYTIIGDPGTFIKGLALGANWIADGRVDGCLVIGAEENDWLTSDAFRLFDRRVILSGGAGAVYLKSGAGAEGGIELQGVTEPYLYTRTQSRGVAARLMAEELMRLKTSAKPMQLCDGLQNTPRLDSAEIAAWKDWSGKRLSPKLILGEGLMAGAAWQCCLAVESARRAECSAALVSVVGCNEQAIGAQFG